MAATEARPKSGGIGESVLRKEDHELIKGQGKFIDDLRLTGMAHAVFVRSPHGAARVTAIDKSAAEAMPGVIAVLTAADLGITGGVPCASNPTGDARQPRRPVLAEGVVRHVGEPVAIVVAEDRFLARDGADAVVVDYDPLPVVVDGAQPSPPTRHACTTSTRTTAAAR